jgi:hypothetical protein
VLVAYDEFQALVRAGSYGLSDLRAEYDSLLGRMQTPAARAGMETAFNASPDELGRAAVKAARRTPARSRKRA